MPSKFLRGALIACACVAAVPAAADAQTSADSCRASAARVSLGAAGVVEPVVANAAGSPCASDSRALTALAPAGPLTAATPQAATRREAGLLGASAGVADVALTLGGQQIRVAAVRASQAAACVGGTTMTEGTSTVDALTIGGVAVPIVADRAVDLSVGPIRVRANQIAGGTTTALILDAAGTQVVLGEATVGGDPCAISNGGDGTTGGNGTVKPGGVGGTTGRGICPVGARYDARTSVCVVNTTGKDGQSIVVGQPFEGPRGGSVLSLSEARALVAAGKLKSSPCLAGSGPDYVVLGGKGNDRITGTDDADRVLAVDGADRVDGGRGDDCIDGGSGRDVLSGALGSDRVYGGAGNDAVNGGSGTDQLIGESGNDTINTGFGRDLVRGGTGNDAINAATAGPASARIDCGTGRDRLRANANEQRRQRGCERRSYLD